MPIELQQPMKEEINAKAVTDLRVSGAAQQRSANQTY
jgi:hypothetical protein